MYPHHVHTILIELYKMPESTYVYKATISHTPLIPGTGKSEWKGPEFQTRQLHSPTVQQVNTYNRNAFSTNQPKSCRQDTPLSGDCEQLRYNLSVHGHQPSAACSGCLTPTAPNTASWFQEEARGVLTSHRRPAFPITREPLAKPSSPTQA